MASKICKIVYFDEDSVTDYVQIVAGGTLEKTTELLNSSDLSEEQKADVSAKGGIGGGCLALLGRGAGGSGGGGLGCAVLLGAGGQGQNQQQGQGKRQNPFHDSGTPPEG